MTVLGRKKNIVITGASSGIGRDIALLLGGRGYNLFLTARRGEKLEDIKKMLGREDIRVEYGTADISSMEDVKTMAAKAHECFQTIDVLINNAGVMLLSAMEDIQVSDWQKMIDVNIKGVLNGVAAFLPGMLKSGEGQIVNVASVAGHQVFPNATVYCATKFAVRAISEGLRQELVDKVRVTTISPGMVKTELTNHIRDGVLKEGIDTAYDQIAIGPESIAQAVAFAIEQPREVSINEILVRPTAQAL